MCPQQKPPATNKIEHSLYKSLGDNVESIRLHAATEFTSQLGSLLCSLPSEESKSELNYVLGRLTKGLSSGRESARPGFALALTEFISQTQTPGNQKLWAIKLESIINEALKRTTRRAAMDRQEERNTYLGRLFGLQAVFNSGALFRDSGLDLYESSLRTLLELATQKPWLREACASTICSVVPRWPDSVKTDLAEQTARLISDSGLLKTAEGVAVRLTLLAEAPDAETGRNPLAGDLTSLAKVLKESDLKDEDSKAKGKGSWNPKLVFVWDLILKIYFDDDQAWRSLRDAAARWDDFWRVVVDESLFAASSSDQRKLWGFSFFNSALLHVKRSSDLSVMFSKNFVRCLINQLGDSERMLHKAGQKTLRVLQTATEAERWMAPVVIKQLIGNHGTPNFDRLTKGKTIEHILCSADIDGLAELVDEYHKIILDPFRTSNEADATVEKSYESRRQWAADQLLNVVRSGNVVKDGKWISKVIKLFVTFGYFEIIDKKKGPQCPLSDNTRSMFRARLMSCLTSLIRVESGEGSWPFKAVSAIHVLQSDKKLKFIIEMTDVISISLQKGLKNLDKIRAKLASATDAKVKSQLTASELLYSMVILQVYNGEPDALDVLNDLPRILSPKSKKRKRSGNGEEPDPIAILVEILLSFLSKPSVLLKTLSKTVFRSFCENLTRAGLDSMFAVLETKEGIKGQYDLFDQEDEVDDDLEMLDTSGGEEAVDSDGGASSSDSSTNSTGDELDDPDEDSDELRALDADLAAILGDSTAMAQDNDANKSDADLSDSAMLELDSKLAAVFKSRSKETSKKKQNQEARELMIGFKTRVLELLEIYIKETHASTALSLEILMPCLKLARETRDKKLAERALGIVKTLGTANKKHQKEELAADLTSNDIGRAWELLETIHEEAGHGSRKLAVSQASLFVVKMLVKADPTSIERAVRVYGTTQTQWLKGEWGGNVQFFNMFVGWCDTVKGKFVKETGNKLAELADSDASDDVRTKREEKTRKETKKKDKKTKAVNVERVEKRKHEVVDESKLVKVGNGKKKQKHKN